MPIINPLYASPHHSVDSFFVINFKNKEFKKRSVVDFDLYYAQTILNSEGFPDGYYVVAFFNYPQYIEFMEDNYPDKNIDDSDYFDKYIECFGVHVIEDILINVRVVETCNNAVWNQYILQDFSIFNKNAANINTYPSKLEEPSFNCDPLKLSIDTKYFSDDSHYTIFIDTKYILNPEYLKTDYRHRVRSTTHDFPWNTYFDDYPEETSVVMTNNFNGQLYIGDKKMTTQYPYWRNNRSYITDSKLNRIYPLY
jgi:hypothetical protein